MRAYLVTKILHIVEAIAARADATVCEFANLTDIPARPVA